MSGSRLVRRHVKCNALFLGLILETPRPSRTCFPRLFRFEGPRLPCSELPTQARPTAGVVCSCSQAQAISA